MDGNKNKMLVAVAEKTVPAAVQRAGRWAHFAACVTLGHVVTYALLQSSFVPPRVQWTEVEAAEESALCLRMLCCAVLQEAAAALALQLPCRRRWVRRALAYLALVVAFVGHCMYVCAVRLLLAAARGNVLVRILCAANILILAGGDLLCFLGLLLGGDN